MAAPGTFTDGSPSTGASAWSSSQATSAPRPKWPAALRSEKLYPRPSSFLHRFTPKNAKIDSVIEVLTVHSAPRHDIEFLDLPEIFHPFDEKTGWDYDKVFVDGMSYHEGHGEAYLNYGIKSETGCLVVVRPDQYVAYVGELEDIGEVAEYFEGILVEQK